MHTTDVSKVAKFAQEVFCLELPLGLEELKKAYRKASKKLHPDVEGGDEEAFKAMRSAYDFIAGLYGNMPGIFRQKSEESGSSFTTVTKEGIPLSELGLGLGPTTNGRDCDICGHNGYTTHHGKHYVVCQACNEQGMVPKKFCCRACNGSGKFTQQRTQRVVNCRKCNGTGIFTHPFSSNPCPVCFGTKTLWSEDTRRVFYNRCWKCEGTGEIKIFNPMLPKGALAPR